MDLQGLQKFINERDQRPSLHFAGREQEIKAINASLDLVRAGRWNGLTQFVTAAPGAGKSTLLNELGKSWKAEQWAETVYFASPGIFASSERAIQNFLSPLGTEWAGMAGRRAMAPARLRDALALTSKSAREKPIALLVDEAQKLRKGDGVTELLLTLHQTNGSRLPILLVLAGLGDTREVLDLCGLSTLASNARLTVLGALSIGEMREVVQAFFERFRIQGNNAQRNGWVESVIGCTHGWPWYLTNALRGAAKSLIEGQGDLAQSSPKAAREYAAVFQREYCEDQMRPFGAMPELLSAVFQSMSEKTGSTRSDLMNTIHDAFEENPRLMIRTSEIQKEAKSLSVERAVFIKLLRKGLIQDFGRDRYNCPIPSLRRYVEDFCAERGFPVSGALRGLEPGQSHRAP